MEEKSNSVFNLSLLSNVDGTPHQAKEQKLAIGFSPMTELALSFRDMSARYKYVFEAFYSYVCSCILTSNVDKTRSSNYLNKVVN